jgi:hypothetical protein
VTQLHECTNLHLLWRDVVNYYFFLSSKYRILLFGVLCYYLLYLNNLYYVKSSNIIVGLVITIVVHFYTDFTSWFLDYFRIHTDFCNLVGIHGMKINDMIYQMMIYIALTDVTATATAALLLICRLVIEYSYLTRLSDCWCANDNVLFKSTPWVKM